ncbi:hypothetical protein Pfo_015760 [Paulownia fortunei]|nr:hypothetical protein Pfo_015760 [Paulownia fortunei]
MAYAALVSLAQTIDQILSHAQYSISLHEKQHIICVHEYVISLQAFFEDFPEKANSLEGRIRDAAYAAEDVIEDFMLEQIGSRNRSIKSTVGPAEVKFKHQLKKVTELINSITGEVMDIKNSFTIKEVQLGDSPAASSSSRVAPTHKDAMVGFDDDLIAIKARRCGEPFKLQVIPIFGMGGIGKTTLARNAYDDPLMMQYFDIRAWVTVSQDYSAQEIFSGLLVSMKVFNVERFVQSNDSMAERSGQSNEPMAEKVYKSLKGRRYLMVIDDIWSTKAWDDVKMLFPDDHNGSRIMLTTRLADVAAYADSSSPPHEMRFLDADQSWNLFQQKAFAQEDCPPELVNIGKEIARSCAGLPLSIVVIGGILSMVSKTRDSWKKIARNVNSAVAAKDGQFEKILSLSYIHLPHHLRPCFLYMGGFPEDYEIHVSKLIKLWVAEGCMKPVVSKSFEEAAEEYLEDLVKRSLVLVTERKSNGKIKSCGLHDLVRDLCIRKAQEENFLRLVMYKYIGEDFLERIKNERRISYAHSYLDCQVDVYGSTIHTIICFQHREEPLSTIRNFRLLRVLDVVNATDYSLGTESFTPLPYSVYELFHLRYLAFEYPMEIPAAISNLQNLQTLIIHPRKTRNSRPLMVRLPFEIWRMPQLRHLVSFFFDLSYHPNLSYSPNEATFVLENLQTLSAVRNLVCTKRVLKKIPNLKKLGIYFAPEDYDINYHLHDLASLHQLEKLKLEIHRGFAFRRKLNPAFPKTLKFLTLSGWGLPWEDTTIVGSLPNLQVLKLRDSACTGDKWETTEGEFPELKFLLIYHSDLKDWITDSSHFPKLKCLMLHHCPRLSEIPGVIGEIPPLELIEVKGDNKSLVESAKRIQEEQQSYGNDALQVRCMPY